MNVFLKCCAMELGSESCIVSLLDGVVEVKPTYVLLFSKILSQAESTWEITNYGRFINQFPPNIIRSIRQFERINEKMCKQKMSIMFNEIYLNDEMLPIYIYIYIIYIWQLKALDFTRFQTKNSSCFLIKTVNFLVK